MSGTFARSIGSLEGFFGTWRFPVFTITVILAYEALLLSLLLWPAGAGEVGSFAGEFRIWCFGYDPATGSLQWASVVTTFTSPLFMIGVLVGLWWAPLRDVMLGSYRRLIPMVATGVGVASLSATLLLSQEVTPRRGALPFPGDALRTQLQAPAFDLINHQGDRVSLADYQGKVVVVTAVYATCGFTCPMIMGQIKRVIETLSEEERQHVVVVGITLDPAHDRPEVLAAMAEGQQVRAPQFQLCTGEPGYVNELLDSLNVSRKLDPETGVIDHANLFLLVDSQGKIAYRLTLGERQERWLESAIKLLVQER